jgi:outer membrane protein, heavy metal efflux system
MRSLKLAWHSFVTWASGPWCGYSRTSTVRRRHQHEAKRAWSNTKSASLLADVDGIPSTTTDYRGSWARGPCHDNSPRMFIARRLLLRLVTVTMIAVATGCTVHPPGEREERSAAQSAGKLFQNPIEDRQFPALSSHPTTDELVRYALLANADLETKYWQWQAAIEQIPQDATQATTLNLAAGTAITNGKTSRSMSTVTLSNDPASDIKWPGKLDAAAKVDLENARAAGIRFHKAQFELRSKVLDAYYDYALNAELVRLEEANQQLLETMVMTTQARAATGSSGQMDLLKAKDELDMSKNDLANLKAQFPPLQAALNALLSRSPDAPIALPDHLPGSTPLPNDDAQLLQLLATKNPELSALAAEARGRKEAVRLAELQWVPDFNLSAGTDLEGITQNLLGQVTMPFLRYEAINAGIAQAQANLRLTDAMLRQTRSDLTSQVIMDITTIRDADRQLDLFGQTILPRTREIVELSSTSYQAGQGSLSDIVEAQRSVVALQRLVANLRTTRDKRVADLESVTAVALETPTTAQTPH